MTNDEAIKWISELIGTMREETSGPLSDSEYRDEVYEALDKAIKALNAIPMLERRCYALTEGYMCPFCSYNCTLREEGKNYFLNKDEEKK